MRGGVWGAVAATLATAAIATLAPAGAQAAKPSVAITSVSEVGGESAQVGALLDSGGEATTYSFQYTDLAGFAAGGFATAASTPSQGIAAGAQAVEVAATLSPLHTSTTYYFQLTATNPSGTVSGKATTFTTSPGAALACEGDACQSLPPEPSDPTLTTLLEGLGNPAVRYRQLNHHRKRQKEKQKHRAHHRAKAKR